MPALALAGRLFQPPPPLVGRFFGPDGRIETIAAARREADAVPMVIGPRGPAAPPITPFEFPFASAAAIWTVNHNLGRRPLQVRVLSPGGVEVAAQVTDVTDNQCLIRFTAPRAGKVIIL